MKSHGFHFAIFLIFALVIGVLTSTSVAKERIMKFRSYSQTESMDEVKANLKAIDQITTKHNYNRVAGSRCYDQAALYVATKMWLAGYRIQTQQFKILDFVEINPPLFEQKSPNPKVYNPKAADGFYGMQYSPSGDVTGVIQPVDIILPPGDTANSNTSGCEMDDFKNFQPGRIALIQRGTCTFRAKALNAQAAGATAVIVFNEGQKGRTDATIGTLSDTMVKIPVIYVNHAIGVELYTLSQQGDVSVHIKIDTKAVVRKTTNVFADTKKGDPNTMALFGAHIDGVPNCPAANDNISAVACIMTAATQLVKSKVEIKNKIRFCFWSAEEIGLLGSKFYVNNATEEELNKISVYINYEMLGSPNWVRFVYDGDGSDTKIPGPPGSIVIEEMYKNYFDIMCLDTDPFPFDGRSDFQAFKDKGIPVGGLLCGYDGVKTERQAAIYGGTAGLIYAPNYHKMNDDLQNMDYNVLAEMLDAIIYSVFVCATEELPKNEYRASYAVSDDCSGDVAEYEGSFMKK